jgi:Asp-tRNA(Asn)/Glu-tRNA(Gln) amidotransferase A subunit family amidase
MVKGRDIGTQPMFRNCKSLFSATVYDRCIEAGFVNSQSEDWDFILANDIKTVFRKQAANEGLFYIHPAYGTVSRYGLLPQASSMDSVGVLCRDLTSGIDVLNIISGEDKNDPFTGKTLRYESQSGGTVTVLGNRYLNVLHTVFRIISCGEFCGNTTRYDGVKYGCRAENISNINDLYTRARTEGLDFDFKECILLGCVVQSEQHYYSIYDKALRIRRLICDCYAELLAETDVLVMPVNENTLALPLLGGFSAVTCRIDGKPVQFICRKGNENKMFGLFGDSMSVSGFCGSDDFGGDTSD